MGLGKKKIYGLLLCLGTHTDGGRSVYPSFWHRHWCVCVMYYCPGRTCCVLPNYVFYSAKKGVCFGGGAEGGGYHVACDKK